MIASLYIIQDSKPLSFRLRLRPSPESNLFPFKLFSLLLFLPHSLPSRFRELGNVHVLSLILRPSDLRRLHFTFRIVSTGISGTSWVSTFQTIWLLFCCMNFQSLLVIVLSVLWQYKVNAYVGYVQYIIGGGVSKTRLENLWKRLVIVV